MTDNLNEGFVLSDVLISLGRVSQHGEYQDSKPNQPFFNFIVYARAFPPVTSKGPRMKGVKSLPLKMSALLVFQKIKKLYYLVSLRILI